MAKPADPIAALHAQLAKDRKEREDLPTKVAAFRMTHKVSDERCAAMIQALHDGRATTLEGAYKVTKP